LQSFLQIKTIKADPDLFDFDMPLRAVYHPLGFPLEIATNSHEILAAAEESWGHFRPMFSVPPLQVRIGVLDGGPVECPVAPVVRAHRSLLARVADAENFSVTDRMQAFAFAWLTRATTDNRPYLRWHFIEGIAWDMLDLYLTPVHAACVRLNNSGVLLCGDSGVGKSSLAFACALKGWTYLADDSSRLVRGRQDRLVIGNPYQIRFRETAINLFPELRDQRFTARATGEFAIELPTARRPDIKTATQCQVDYVVFLNRVPSGCARFFPFPRHTAMQWLEQTIACWEQETIEAHKDSLRRLLTAEILELRYTDLASAVELLETLVRDGPHSLSGFCLAEEGRENA
jgi:HPr Serine kinase C-terminal domain